ncbi:MAG: dihydropteroate synthase DHPS [Thermoplasmata archaeon]|nr:dihydropteroate synthase DHPS [Thermoplasmata archaeon]
MMVISEKINGMFRKVGRTIDARDVAGLQEIVHANVAAGANALDINTGPGRDNAAEDIVWMVKTVQEVTDLPLSIDSPLAKVLKAGVEACENAIIINSIPAEGERMATLYPIAADHDADIICLTFSEKEGINLSADRRAELAMLHLATAMEFEIEPNKLMFDPLILPINCAQDQPQEVFAALEMFKTLASPPPGSTVGLSNVSASMKHRKLMNRTLLAMLCAHGLTSAIMDPFDVDLMNVAKTAEIMMNEKLYADDYLKA